MSIWRLKVFGKKEGERSNRSQKIKDERLHLLQLSGNPGQLSRFYQLSAKTYLRVISHQEVNCDTDSHIRGKNPSPVQTASFLASGTVLSVSKMWIFVIELFPVFRFFLSFLSFFEYHHSIFKTSWNSVPNGLRFSPSPLDPYLPGTPILN